MFIQKTHFEVEVCLANPTLQPCRPQKAAQSNLRAVVARTPPLPSPSTNSTAVMCFSKKKFGAFNARGNISEGLEPMPNRFVVLLPSQCPMGNGVDGNKSQWRLATQGVGGGAGNGGTVPRFPPWEHADNST